MSAHTEGRIRIRIFRPADGDRAGGLDVRIVSSRPVNAGKLFEGREPRHVPALVPSLFAVCGMAHLLAARLALGIEDDGRTHRVARAALAETAREHVLHMALALGEPRALAPARALMDLPRGMLQDDAGDGARELEHVLENDVFGMPPGSWLEMDGLRKLRDWAAKTDALAARWIAPMLREPMAGAGGAECRPLERLNGEFAAGMLHGPRHEDFMAHPELDGAPAETGPHARHHAHPLVAAARRAHGPGLLARAIARLVDLARIPGERRQEGPWAAATIGDIRVAQVDSPRGLLVHSARSDGRRVAEYRILAPTEWNFHPRGVARRAIASLHVIGDDGKLETTAHAVAEAVDPCVGLDIRVMRHA